MTKVSPNEDHFYIRLADNLNYFIHHDGKFLKIGELDLFIPSEKKTFVMNEDRTISPVYNREYIIGLNENGLLILEKIEEQD